MESSQRRFEEVEYALRAYLVLKNQAAVDEKQGADVADLVKNEDGLLIRNLSPFELNYLYDNRALLQQPRQILKRLDHHLRERAETTQVSVPAPRMIGK